MAIHQAYRDLLEELHVETIRGATQGTAAIQAMPPALYFPKALQKKREPGSKASNYMTGIVIGAALACGAFALKFNTNREAPQVPQLPVQVAQIAPPPVIVKPEDSASLRVEVDLMKKILSGLVQSVQTLTQQSDPKAQVVEDTTETQFPYAIQVVTEKANLRSGPSRTEKTVTVVPKDTVLLAMAKQDGWTRVSTPKGEIAWVSSDIVAEHKD